MPQPGRQQLNTSKVEVKKATKAGKADARFKNPVRVEKQSATAAKKVVAKGNEKARGQQEAALTKVSTGARPTDTAQGVVSAHAYAMADMKADAKKRGEKLVSMKDRTFLTPKERERLERSLAPKKPDKAALEPSYRQATPQETAQLQLSQRSFEQSRPGERKEGLRRQIGRLIQLGHPPHVAEQPVACQTPNCENNATSDVVCESCLSGGDKAGATYKDAPRGLLTPRNSQAK